MCCPISLGMLGQEWESTGAGFWLTWRRRQWSVWWFLLLWLFFFFVRKLYVFGREKSGEPEFLVYERRNFVWQARPDWALNRITRVLRARKMMLEDNEAGRTVWIDGRAPTGLRGWANWAGPKESSFVIPLLWIRAQDPGREDGERITYVCLSLSVCVCVCLGGWTLLVLPFVSLMISAVCPANSGLSAGHDLNKWTSSQPMSYPASPKNLPASEWNYETQVDVNYVAEIYLSRRGPTGPCSQLTGERAWMATKLYGEQLREQPNKQKNTFTRHGSKGQCEQHSWRTLFHMPQNTRMRFTIQCIHCKSMKSSKSLL